jgi:hypothetical protein
VRAVTDTSVIQRLIGRARFRIRMQGALDGATTATILAAALALVSVFAMRMEFVSGTTGMIMLALAGLVVIGGAVIGAMKPLDDEMIARRIDRASNLSDRLSTAIAFNRTLAADPSVAADDDETYEMMIAAIKDGTRAAPRAKIEAATPYAMPKDLKAAIGFLAVSALAAGLAIPPVDRAAALYKAEPDFGKRGSEILLRGKNLLTGVTAPIASASSTTKVIGAPAVESDAGFVPRDAYVYLGPEGKGSPIQVLDWRAETIRVRIPENAEIGSTKLTVYIGKDQKVGPVDFTVVADDDERLIPPDAVVLDPDERAYVESILAQLKDLAKREKIQELDDFVAKIEKLLKDVEQGKVTKEQLLAELAKAEELLNKGGEPDQKDIAKKLSELGQELQKSELTKDLGKAFEKNDLEKAKEELEELARKLEKSGQQKELEKLEEMMKDPKLTEQQKQELQKKIDELKKEMNKDLEELKEKLADKDNKLTDQEKKDLQKKIEEMKKEKPLTEQQKQELQKQLDQVSKQMQKQDEKDKQQQSEQIQKMQKEIKRLEKEKQEAKTEQERLKAERQLQKQKDELQKLQKDDDRKNQSAQRQALKRLQRDMEKAAEQLQKPQNKQESQEEKDERERQASRKIKDAARETGKVDQDQRKQNAQKKMSSQMEDLREAMRRAKQKGNKGPNDPFGKNARNQDFDKRRRGGKGNQGAWRPGQGNQPGGQQPGGQGNQPGGQKWGVGTSDPYGDETAKTGKTTDKDITGKEGNQGTSKRETILAAAQKGFASTSYKKVYAEYKDKIEDVMRNEKIPSSYKYYVKRYFAKIHPSGTPESVETAPVPAPGK